MLLLIVVFPYLCILSSELSPAVLTILACLELCVIGCLAWGSGFEHVSILKKEKIKIKIPKVQIEMELR